MPDTPATDTAAPAARRAPSNPLLGAARLLLIAGVSLAYVLFALVYRLLVREPRRQWRLGTRGTHSWARILCRLSGYRVRVDGPLPPDGVLLAPNHLGYVDIGVIASCAPCCYIAKAELSSWPLYGLAIRAYHHIYVVRKKTRSMLDVTRAIRERLENGFSLCTFFEGTSSGGTDVLPFRPPLLQPVIDAGAQVVPVASVWRARDPRVDLAEDVAYWRPEHTFVPHIIRHLGLRGGFDVTVRFGAPIDTTGLDRKELAARLHADVTRLLRAGPAA